ncbi:EpsG family protein [Blautia wexlerae]|uniref:EpsG family protein n=1 Tax=Blautia wexlerae TaxID=418240 RepID=UPI0003FD620C|nr:EpsG family protein [Blautia wexlerae]
MSQTTFVIVWLAMMAVILNITLVVRQENVLGKKEIRANWLFAICVFAPIFIQASFRGDIGDSNSYRKMFGELPNTINELVAYIPTVTKDKGFFFLSGLIKIIFGSNTIVYFLILALLQSIVLVAVYRKYSSQYLVSIFLFVASTDYLSWMFNGIRQFTAVTLLFAATGLMLKKKWISTLVIILLASTIHQSALLMIPIVIIAQGKAWNKRSVIFLVAAMIAIVFVNQFTNILDSMMQETQYANVVSDWNEWGDDGTNVLRVLVYSIPTILSLIGIKYIQAEDDPVINFCTNMSIISTGIYIISMFTSGIFIGRLPIYASLYNYILLPWETDHMFTKESKRLIMIVMVAAYLVFYWYQIEVVW